MTLMRSTLTKTTYGWASPFGLRAGRRAPFEYGFEDVLHGSEWVSSSVPPSENHKFGKGRVRERKG